MFKKNENLPEVYVNHVKEIEPVILCLWTIKYSQCVDSFLWQTAS